jgi:hypothetical protein
MARRPPSRHRRRAPRCSADAQSSPASIVHPRVSTVVPAAVPQGCPSSVSPDCLHVTTCLLLRGAPRRRRERLAFAEANAEAVVAKRRHLFEWSISSLTRSVGTPFAFPTSRRSRNRPRAPHRSVVVELPKKLPRVPASLETPKRFVRAGEPTGSKPRCVTQLPQLDQPRRIDPLMAPLTDEASFDCERESELRIARARRP